MKGKIRFTYLAFFLIIIFSLCTVNVFADDEEDPPIATDSVPVVTEPAPVETNPPKPATQPTTKKKKVTQATKATKATKPKQQQNKTYATSPRVNTNNNNNNIYSTKKATSPTKSSSVASTKASTSPVYDVKGNVDTDTLKKNDWKSIAEQLSKSDNKKSNDDADSFNFIRDNDSSEDNGIWILFTGIGLEVLAAVIIITLIVLSVKRKRNLKYRQASEGPRSVQANQRQNPRGASQQRPAQRAPQRQPGRSQQRQVNRRSKYDTDEIYVPRNSRSSNGGRYKPKH